MPERSRWRTALAALQNRWRGVLLSLVGVVAIVWLALTGQLGLYIHPRYFEFTIVMAVIAGMAVVAAFAVVPGAEPDHDHDHVHGHAHDDHVGDPGIQDARGGGSGTRAVWAVLSVVVVAATAVALLVIPPATLTSATVAQRDLNASAAVAEEAPELVGTDTAGFTVKDWASLLRQGAGEEYFAGKTADITGFVTPDADDPENVFYIARFVVTCCAVDAQPVGVPVYLPGWQHDYAIDSWVSATGGFGPNPSGTSAQAIVFEPAELTAVDQPAEPYVY
ncbi:TIGR03943 family protein [Herbiconiux moechotypicola]|uniref:TIGR03943 family protein n=1 Tax=Herbiconiux moechotypicola TaxID=637393 RepID=A0ABN3D966_9MICO|nr:TIGR03943 family protein [Herbiconiux moechotypicola]MCS5728230.1 TIGR03943 family protein [Herbiconiux moechotypicola]